MDTAAFGKVGEHPQPFFRFPGFADTPQLLDYVHGRGMAVFGSDVWASDWRKMTPQEELKLILDRLEKEKKGIVLFHDNKPVTAKMLPDFLRALKERGFKVVHLIAGSGQDADRGSRRGLEVDDGADRRQDPQGQAAREAQDRGA